MIQERIDNILNEKEILEQTIDENLKIFKDDDTLKKYKETMWRIFKQPIDHFEYQSEEENNNENDAGESSHQQRKDDEDQNKTQEAGETGEQEDSAKNKDAGNDNKNGNKR